MEIQFHQQKHHKKANIPINKRSKLKGKNEAAANNGGSSKFVGVRQRPSGRWVAEIKDTTQKIRMWLGTFETAEQAARAYDEAACLLRGSNTRTNFVTHVSMDSPIASRIRNLLNNKKDSSRKQQEQEQQRSRHDQQSEVSTPPSSITATYTSTTTSSCSSVVSEEHNSHSSGVVGDHTRSFDDAHDAYKPDLSNCTEDFEMVSSQYDLSWNFEQGLFNKFSFAQEVMEFPQDMVELAADQTSDEFSEFDRMKVERQISASLYAINGVQEYMDHTFYDPTEALVWDLPPLCS